MIGWSPPQVHGPNPILVFFGNCFPESCFKICSERSPSKTYPKVSMVLSELLCCSLTRSTHISLILSYLCSKWSYFWYSLALLPISLSFLRKASFQENVSHNFVIESWMYSQHPRPCVHFSQELWQTYYPKGYFLFSYSLCKKYPVVPGYKKGN